MTQLQGAGRPKLSDIQKEIQAKLKKYDSKLMMARYLLMPFSEFEDYKKDPTLPVVEYFMVNLLSDGISRNNFQIYQYFFERCFGASDKNVNVNIKGNSLYKQIMSDIHGKDFNDEETLD